MARMMGRAWNARQGYETCDCDRKCCRHRRATETRRERRIEKRELAREITKEMAA
jgi:hypothetical protein